MEQFSKLVRTYFHIRHNVFSLLERARELFEEVYGGENLKLLKNYRIEKQQNFSGQYVAEVAPKNRGDFILHHHQIMVFERELSYFPRLPATVENKADKLRGPGPADVAAVENHGLRHIPAAVSGKPETPRQVHIFFVGDEIFVKILIPSSAGFRNSCLIEGGFAVHGSRARRAKYVRISIILPAIHFPLPPVNHPSRFKNLNPGAVQNPGFRINIK